MAIVPQYQTSQNERAVSGVSASADSFGAIQARQQQRMAGAVNQAGSKLADYAIKEQERENVIQFQTGIAAYEKRMAEFKVEADKRNGYNAKGLAKEGEEFSVKAMDEILKTMPNEVVKEQFKRRAMSSQTSYVTNFAGHENRQLEHAQQQAHIAATKSAVDNSIAFHDDAEVLAKNKVTISNNLAIEAMQQGYDAETAKLKKQETFNILHSGVIKAKLANDDTAGAKKYLEANESEMNGTALTNAKESVRKHGIKAKAQYLADVIMSKGVSESKALEMAYKSNIPEVRDSVVNRVKSRYADARRIENEQYSDNLNVVYKHLLQGGSFEDMSPEVIDGIKGKDLSTLLSLEKKIKAGGKPETDWGVWTDIQTKMLDDKGRKWIVANAGSLLTQLGPTQQKELRKYIQDGVSDSERSVIQTKNQILTQAYEVLGAKKNKAKQGAISQKFNQFIAAWEANPANKGKKFGAAEAQDAYDSMVIEITKENNYWADKEFNVGDPKQFDEYFKGYNIVAVSKVAKALEDRGQKPTVNKIKSILQNYESKRAN